MSRFLFLVLFLGCFAACDGGDAQSDLGAQVDMGVSDGAHD